MICLWLKNKFYDAWINSLNDTYFIERTMINMDLDPMECEWIKYPINPNCHNPIKIEDSDKSIEWITEKLIDYNAIATKVDQIPKMAKEYYSIKVIQSLTRIIERQNDILEKYFFEGKGVPENIKQNPVENKVIMESMKKMIPTESDYIFRSGRRLKRYLSENENIPLPSFDSLKSIAKYLLTQKVNWNPSFLTKLNELK